MFFHLYFIISNYFVQRELYNNTIWKHKKYIKNRFETSQFKENRFFNLNDTKGYAQEILKVHDAPQLNLTDVTTAERIVSLFTV
jgi:hypothetical protein